MSHSRDANAPPVRTGAPESDLVVRKVKKAAWLVNVARSCMANLQTPQPVPVQPSGLSNQFAPAVAPPARRRAIQRAPLIPVVLGRWSPANEAGGGQEVRNLSLMSAVMSSVPVKSGPQAPPLVTVPLPGVRARSCTFLMTGRW